eukprot:gnl/TRDRNA2_/TRDRNA2_171906_c16_seq16.p1 gnl/TRDRNA2_/TRDRNA2_171906_c16~~gnl/TRDRNA2_/TRDRNA2_171906_c16_seq16.p1  ORF type:complete len:131 (-),score=9.87 gnl/TRDRNA2_/TRDRNA2_171906_c16_seq16:159-551(-)
MCHCSASSAKIANSLPSEWLTIAKAHAELARSWALNSLTRLSASLAKAVNSSSSYWQTFAQAHAAFASSCALNSLVRRSELVAKGVNILHGRSMLLLVQAAAYAMLASPLASSSPASALRRVCCTNDSRA